MAGIEAQHAYMKRITLFVLFLIFPSSGVFAADEPNIVIGTVTEFPNTPAMLHRQDQVYISVHYKSDMPIYMYSVAELKGNAQSGIHSFGHFEPYPAGQGDAFFFFFMTSNTPSNIDSIEIIAVSAANRMISKSFEIPVAFSWDGVSAPKQGQLPAWVQRELAKKIVLPTSP